MKDDDFDFSPPPRRREPKQFQPPPWEEDAFHRLQEQRVNEDDAVAAGPARQDGDGEVERGLTAEKPPAEKTEVAEVAGGEHAERPEAGKRVSEVDEAAMIEMFARLRAEDPPATQAVFKAAVASSMVMIAIGAMLLVWAMAAFVGSRRTGTFGLLAGFTMSGFGAGFIAAGWWMIRRALKRRGVL